MPTCPACNGKLRLVHRRTIDKVQSLFVPLKRYRCRNLDCEWEGNIRGDNNFDAFRSWLPWAVAIAGSLIIGGIIAKIL